MSFDATWEKTFMALAEKPQTKVQQKAKWQNKENREPNQPHLDAARRDSTPSSISDRRLSLSPSAGPKTRRNEEASKSEEPKSAKTAAARFSALKPSESWSRMRSRSRSGSVQSVGQQPWRGRSLSTMSLPSVDDLQSSGWTPAGRLRRSSTSFTPRRLSGVYSRRFSEGGGGHAKEAASEIARFREATDQPADAPPEYSGHVVEVTGDPTGVSNGTYYYTEKPSRKPFFTRHAPHKATLAPRQSHGMWFLLAWGKEKNGKDTWTDYCSPHDGELPPTSGWRKCWRGEDKLKWIFGDEVPIKVTIFKDKATLPRSPSTSNTE